MKSNKYYVYALINPQDGSPFYVGKGCGSLVKWHLSTTDYLRIGIPQKGLHN